jgi:hypothetical protein
MANATVAFDGGRVNDADALGSIWTDLGGGKCASEPDFVYQGVAAVSEKVGTTEGGVALDMVATVDYTTPKVWIAKCIATNSSALNNKGATGGILEIGSGGRRADYDRYYVIGGDTYPIQGGWLIIPIDPNGGNQSARPGTAPTLTAIDYYGWACDFGATSKAENVALDAVDWINNGSGLTCTDGISGTDGNFALFATTDEDAAGNNRWGIVSTREGILYVVGVLTLGDSGTGVEFTSVGEVVVWPDAEFLNSVGFFGLDIHLQNAASVVSITNGTFISRGTSGGTVDTRAVVETIGTSGTATLSGCNFQNLADFICTSAISVQDCNIETVALTQGSADIEGCVITTHSATSVACLQDPTFAASTDLNNCEFVFGSGGHAIELSAVGATVTLTNITFTGYGADTTDNAAIDVTAATGTTTINWSGGTEPTYKTAGATVIIQNTVNVSVTALDSGSAVEGARVHLLADTGGDLPVDLSTTITRSGSVATATATAHKLTAGQLVRIKGADQPEYNGIKTVATTPTANTFTFTVSGTPTTPATGTITSTGFIINALTNASGVAENTGWPFSSDQPVTGVIRKGSAVPVYKDASIVGTITNTGLSITATMISDA